MSKILVVDDEQRYRHHISRVLEQDGHEIRTADDGPHAVLEGSHFRPDVLITDWMLKSHLHGLQVAEVLRTIVPRLQTVLVTGFPSADLRGEARQHQVITFLEKPFEIDDLRVAARNATSVTDVQPYRSPIAVLEIDDAGRVLFANARARQLLAETPAGADAADLTDVFEGGAAALLPAAAERWLDLTPHTASRKPWHLRVRQRPEDGIGLMVVVPDEQRYQMRHSIVHTLMGLEPQRALGWPIAGRALIVDSDSTIRRVIAAQIHDAGGVCHVAENLDIARRTLERDPGIEIVIVDDYLLAGSVPEFVRTVRALHPQVRIVGTSGSFRAGELEAMGIDEFLLKPWTLVDLINLLRNHRGSCPACGLLLPLRPPRANETPSLWICSGCGYQANAMLDEASPADVLRNARRAEEP